MDRRKSIKALLIGTAASGALIQSCDTKVGDKSGADTPAGGKASVDEADRMEEEKKANKYLKDATFFTPGELATINILVDIIIPKDAVSGSANDAKVPDFIEFIVKDMPRHQTPMRGGLRWLEMESLKRFEKSFAGINEKQRIEIIDDIAYPGKAKPGMKQGESFFNLVRNLTVTGFYTSAIGVQDVGYLGNKANEWNGVPDEVLKQYNLAYSEKELKECVSFVKA